MNQIWNIEDKEKFLLTYDNEQTQKTLKNVFYKSYPEEYRLNKDLYNFNQDEIAEVIKNANPHNKQTAKSLARFIKQYITWGMSLRSSSSNINPMDAVDESYFDDLVDKTKKVYYSYDEFLLLLEEMQNGQDQAFLFLIWEGIIGRSFSQLRELHYSDIKWDTNEVYVKERDMNIKVSDDCMKYLEKAQKETTYYTYNPETKEYNESGLFRSDFVFKNLVSPRSTEDRMVNPSVFYKRLNLLREEFQLEYMTPNSIRNSGMIKMAVDLFEEYGQLEYEQFKIIGDKYNYATVNSGGFEYYNTTLMKEFISEDNLKTLYNIDVKF